MNKLFLFVRIALLGTPAWMNAEGKSYRVNPLKAWELARAYIAAQGGKQKPWWQSKTIWINLVIASLLLAEANIESLQGLLPEWLQKSLVFALPIINVWLRVFTTQGLSFKPQMPQGEKDAQ